MRPIYRGGTYWNEDSGREIIQVSFSGGRSSAYMTRRLLTEFSGLFDFIVTFANTSREHPRTLEFVHECDRHFGFGTVWLEAIAHPGERRSSTHRVVTYETAARDGEVFEAYIRKYGVPNAAFPQCTRELKLNPMKSYLRSVGIDASKVKTAIGIRADEARRVSKDAEAQSIIYPLVDWFPADKADVLEWWRAQPFDLNLEEFEGNCRACFKKSMRKQFLQIAKDPSAYDFTRRMELLYRDVGPQDGQRVFFRGNLDTDAVFALYREVAGGPMQPDAADENGGCSESCEVYPT